LPKRSASLAVFFQSQSSQTFFRTEQNSVQNKIKLSLTFDLWKKKAKKQPLANRNEKKCILALSPRLLTFVITLALLWKHPSQNGALSTRKEGVSRVGKKT